MKKNTLLVLAIILIPIIIAGTLAMAGASNYTHDENGSEGENNEETTTEGSSVLVPVKQVDELHGNEEFAPERSALI